MERTKNTDDELVDKTEQESHNNAAENTGCFSISEIIGGSGIISNPWRHTYCLEHGSILGSPYYYGVLGRENGI